MTSAAVGRQSFEIADQNGKVGYSIELPVGDYDVTVLHACCTETNKSLLVPAAGAELMLP